MSEPNLEKAPGPRPARLAALIAVIVVCVVFFALASLGARQVAANQRVLGFLDPLIEAIRSSGSRLMKAGSESGLSLVKLLAVASGFTLAAALVARHLRAWPLLLLAAGITFAAWGQVELVHNQALRGSYLYAIAAASAFLLGIFCPAPDLAQDRSPQAFRRRDAVALAVLSILALLFRLYALNELPSPFNGEMIISMLASRTFDGLAWYTPNGIASNSTGLVHLLPQMMFYELYGTSVYALRLAAVFYGVMAVPLFYWLVQRLSGTVAAVLATMLLVSAPEQLYWSRLESTNFAPIPVLALVTAHLGLSLIERITFWRVAAVALWLPFGRYFYTAGAAMLFYPWLQYLHAMLFVHRSWRKIWYVVPLLAGGTALWMGSLSLITWLIRGGTFMVNNPAQHGELILRGAGPYAGLGLPRLLYLQAESSWTNLVAIVESIAYHGGFSEWYQRGLVIDGVTLMVPSVVALIAISLFYLFGQLQRPRAFAVVLWVAVGLLPAVLSMQPTDRRFLLIFPALYIAVGITATAFVRVTAQRGGKLAAGIVASLALLAVAATTLTSLTSHFLLRTHVTGVEELVEFSKPIFENSDTILFDSDASWALVLAWGNAEHFLENPPCYRSVRIGEWLDALLHPTCEFSETAYRGLLSEERIEAARAAHRSEHVTLLVDLFMPSRVKVDMLRGLFPAAAERSNSGRETPSYVAFTVNPSDVEALRSPDLEVGPDVSDATARSNKILARTPLKLLPTTDLQGDAVRIRGGMQIQSTGWYTFGIFPACAAATLTVDGSPVQGGSLALPMLSGLHRVELQIASLASCTTPITISSQATGDLGTPEPSSPTLTSQYSTDVADAAARPLQPFAGYGPATPFADVAGRVIVDFGIDDAGEVFLLTQTSGNNLHGQRLSPDGGVLASWDVTFPTYLPIWGLSVAADGTSNVLVGGPVIRYDRNGAALDPWMQTPIYSAEVAPLRDGRMLAAIPQESAIFILGHDGSVQEQWRTFEGGAGKFVYPISVSTDQTGTIVVLQDNNEVLLFHTPTDSFEPVFSGSFNVDYFEPPNPRRVAFDGPDLLLFTDPVGNTPLVYDRSGTRRLAARPENDLSTRGFRAPTRMHASRNFLYVLDWQRRMWRLPKLTSIPDQKAAAGGR